MKRLDIETWMVIFNNTKERNEEVEAIYLDNVGKDGEWGLCVDCELFEDGFKTEEEALERLDCLKAICEGSMKPLEKASEIYFKLKKLYSDGNRQLESYIDIAKEYAELKSKSGSLRNGINQVYTLNGREYTMYNTFYVDFRHMMFVEDLTMMVYRLYGGKGYNTYTLIEAIEKFEAKEEN